MHRCIEKLVGSSISFISVGYLIGIVLLINYFDRLNAYDMSSNIISTLDMTPLSASVATRKHFPMIRPFRL